MLLNQLTDKKISLFYNVDLTDRHRKVVWFTCFIKVRPHIKCKLITFLQRVHFSLVYFLFFT